MTGQPMAHTGDCANVSWYAERHQDDRDYLYAEVLRNDVRRGPSGLEQRLVPVYYIIVKRVTRSGNREVARFAYKPTRKPNPLVLGNRTVTRLVREEMEKRS